MLKTSILFFFKGFGALASLISGILISRIYGVDVYGEYGLILSYITIFSIIATWGINVFQVEHNLKYLNINLLKYWLKISLPIVFLFSFFLYLNLKHTYLSLIVIVYSMLTIKGSILMLQEKQYLNAIVDDVLKFGLLIFALIFSYYYFPTEDFFIVYFFSNFILFFVVLFIFLKNTKFSNQNTTEKRNLNLSLNYGFVPTLSALIILLNAQLDRIILSYTVNDEMVGIYFASQTLLALITYCTVSVMMVITPKLLNFYKNKNYDSLRKVSIKYNILLLVFSLVILVISFLFGKKYFELYNIDNQEGYIALIILILGGFLSQIFGFGMTIAAYSKLKSKMLYYQVFTLTISSILCFILSNQWGIIGASISTSFSLILIKFLVWIDFRKKGIRVGLV